MSQLKSQPHTLSQSAPNRVTEPEDTIRSEIAITNQLEIQELKQLVARQSAKIRDLEQSLNELTSVPTPQSNLTKGATSSRRKML
jgi:hypothetical protein